MVVTGVETVDFSAVPGMEAVDFSVIPLPIDEDIVELRSWAAHIVKTQSIPERLREAVYERIVALQRDAVLQKELQHADNFDRWLEAQQGGDATHSFKVGLPILADADEPGVGQASTSSDKFAEQFQFIMTQLSADIVRDLLTVESRMATEMSGLIRARDWELTRLQRECQHLVDNPDLPENASRLSSLNHNIRQIHSVYSAQVAELSGRQRTAFRNLVRQLYESGEWPADVAVRENATPPSGGAIAAGAAMMERRQIDESFTFHIGAQMKSMHNARLRSTTDPLESCRASSDEAVRLHVASTLYGHSLTGLVLLVDSKDPLYHFYNHTEFLRLCEQSTDLHFPSLAKQLSAVEEQTLQTRKAQRAKLTGDGAAAAAASSATNLSALQPGDVYITRHSNLGSIHVVFHVVVDKDLATRDINSRHPALAGLRTVVRTATQCGVTHFSIPLLLTHSTNESHTIQWCSKRAELVFKCVKGFLIEVCSVGSYDPLCGASRPASPHFSIDFLLPDGLSKQVYTQLSTMLPSIFQPVPSVFA